MRLRQFALATACTFALVNVATARDASPSRYIDLVNRANDSVSTLSVAAVGSNDLVPVALGGRVRGGGGSTTFAIAGEGCRFDFHFGFRNGRSLVQRDVDVCRNSTLRLQRNPRALDAAGVDEGLRLSDAGTPTR